VAARLKVYATRIGFHEVIVAAPNQKAALEAWDIGENLFATGAAAVTEDPGGTEAALAQPGVALRRLAGSSEPFRPASEPSSVPDAPAPKRKAAARPAPDRSRLDAAEAALRVAREAHAAALAALEEEARALDARRRNVEADFNRHETALESERRKAETEFRRRGG
jgi:hypothetical protein